MKIHTGVSHFPRYYKKIGDICEMAEVESFITTKPKKGTLVNWREVMGKKFRFVLPAPTALTDPDWNKAGTGFWRDGAQGFKEGAERDFITKTMFKSAGILQCITFLFPTPVSFRPTEDNRQRIMDYFKPFVEKKQRVIWAPTGLWDMEKLLRDTAGTGIFIAQNPLDVNFIQDDEEFRYLRIENIASKNVTSEINMEKILEACDGAKRVFAVFKTSNPLRDANAFNRFLSEEI
ncbi:hypothetical protein KKF34_10260 [Myxococcota bacterium]|nr:hypothetical protein [Myxococcota bacterium]MBU1382660.1 hypothetical protein [Myxococcota bacterium]MBU1497248.1 hypothetical protein [Myxococcota bacterium]